LLGGTPMPSTPCTQNAVTMTCCIDKRIDDTRRFLPNKQLGHGEWVNPVIKLGPWRTQLPIYL
jgi:hypothetical protein